jgi:hypothetical protein
MNSLIRRAIRKQDRLLKRFGKNKIPFYWDRYRAQRNFVVKLIKKAKFDYKQKVDSLLANPVTSPKKWWSIAKSQYGNKLCSSIPDLLENDIRISDSKLKAQIFNDYFANQSTLINADVAPVPSLPTLPFSLSSIVVNESEVLCI